MFRPYKVILRPSKKTDPRVNYVSLHCGIPNAYKFLLEKCKTHKLVYVELCDGFDMKLEHYLERQYIKITVCKMHRNQFKISQVKSTKLKATVHKKKDLLCSI